MVAQITPFVQSIHNVGALALRHGPLLAGNSQGMYLDL